MNNLSSYCGLVDAKIRASDKYLPVLYDLEVLGWNVQVLDKLTKISKFKVETQILIIQNENLLNNCCHLEERVLNDRG